jgi:hypothetical protein
MGEIFCPACLSTIELLSGHKILEVFMITKHLNGVGCTFQLQSPFLECTDNGHQLLVVDFIIAFYRAMFLGEKGDRVEDPFIIILGEDASRDIIQSVGFYDCFTVIVEVIKNWGGGEGMLESGKGVGTSGVPNECSVFSSEAS